MVNTLLGCVVEGVEGKKIKEIMATGGLRMSINEKEFILEALRQDQRIDGRTPFDYRDLKINFLKHKEDGSVEVHLGHTRVLCVVSGQITQPYPDRPNEGSLAIFTEFSPMADPAFEPGRPSEMAVELGRIIDRGLRYFSSKSKNYVLFCSICFEFSCHCSSANTVQEYIQRCFLFHNSRSC